MAMVLINTGNTSQETLDMIETYIQWSQDYAALATEDMADFAGLC
jgi:hypothetical protein